MIRIEATNTIYSELFTVTFLHSGYTTPIDNFLSKGISIVPDDDTKKLFAEYKMNYRFFNNVLICYAQCSLFAPPAPEPKVPFIKIDDSTKIRFLVKNSSDFFTKTYVAAAGNKKKYQFSNKANNVNGSEISLSASVDTYNAANDYEQGTIVQNGSNLFGALKTVMAASHILITDAGFWEPLVPFEQVVSNADLKDAAIVNTDEDCFGVIDMYKTVSSGSYQFFGTNDELIRPTPSFTIKFKSKLKF